MKAKDYAERYKADPTPEALGRVALDMLIEMGEIVKQRNAKSNAAMFAILNEIDSKWRAFVFLVGDQTIRANGLMGMIEKYMPEIYHYWIDYRRSTAR